MRSPPHEEQDDAAARAAPRAIVVHEAIAQEGDAELARPVSSLAWSGLAAGLSMGFSFVAIGILREGLPEAGWRTLVENLGYTVGFLVVVLGRQQLFTENTLTPILPLLKRRDAATFRAVARLWAVVLVANLVGTFLFAWVMAASPILAPSTREALDAVAAHSLGHGTLALFLKAIFAGWLIATMVWLLPGAETARPQIIAVMTYLTGVGGFAHVIVGSTEVLYLVHRHLATVGDYASYALVTLAGNVVGGVTLVAILNHAQVKEERLD
jgi:formate/nitrite transporter FocA (FNT family)